MKHWALTVSRPSANVTLIILRVADLEERVLLLGFGELPFQLLNPLL
jgi:hypothetical protein